MAASRWLVIAAMAWATAVSGQASEAHDRRDGFVCNVTDLALQGANFPDNPLFLQQDSLGYLWFFSDVSAYRFNGSSYQTYPYPLLFNAPIDFEFLRNVATLPNGHFACHFANERESIPTADTLCAFDPIHLQPTPASAVPTSGKDEQLITLMGSQGGDGGAVWLLEDPQSHIKRAAQATPSADGLTPLFEAPPGFVIAPMFSSARTGSFFLLLQDAADPDSCGTVHCLDGRCTTTWDNWDYTRGVSPLRRHQNHNMWFDADGRFLTLVHRHESKPPYDNHLFWIHQQDGPMIPDTAGLDPVDWTARLDIKRGYRGSEIAFNEASQQLWVFVRNELQIFHRNGDLLARTTLPMAERFTLGIHNVNFLNEREAVVISTFGLVHVTIDKKPFEYLTIEQGEKVYNLGSRSMISWGPDTVLLMTDASGIYTIENGRIRSQIPEINRCSGMVADGNELIFVKADSLIRTTGIRLSGARKIADSPQTMSWCLEPDGEDRWIVGHEGLSILENGQVTREFNDRIQNAYGVVDWGTIRLVASNSGVWVLEGDSIQRLADRHPELAPWTSPCHAVMVASTGELWISTKGDGLLRWDPARATVQPFGVGEGLPSNVVYAAVEAGDGSVWASSNQGLIRISPETDGIQVFGSKHGLVETEFNRTSFLQHTDGRIFFGAIAGVVAFDPMDPAFATMDASFHLIVDRILQHNQSERAVKDITLPFRREPHVNLGPYDDFLSIRPRVLDPSGAAYSYAYRVHPEGVEPTEPWVLLDEGQIQLSNLPPGTWQLQIRAKGLESGWLPQILSFPITVSIPFYLQGGYQVAGVLLAFGLIFLINALRSRNLKRRNELLESRIASRTEKLQQAVALKDAYLSETHHRVKNNLQIISSLLDLQAAQVKDDGIREQFNISKTRIDSIALIHQRLYNKPDIQSIDFKSFLIEMMRLIERSQLNPSDQTALTILGDDLQIRHRDGVPLGMIFNELFTNTIKHVVPLGRETSVEIAIETFADGRVQLTYDDHGPGLPSSVAFEEMESLGLRLVGRFIHQLGGTAIVDPARRSRVLIEFVQS